MTQAPRVFSNHLQAGVVPKNQVQITVTFRLPFLSPPVVVISPQWKTTGNAVIPTIHEVDTDSFTMYSGDVASDYYIHWVAVGNVDLEGVHK